MSTSILNVGPDLKIILSCLIHRKKVVLLQLYYDGLSVSYLMRGSLFGTLVVDRPNKPFVYTS